MQTLVPCIPEFQRPREKSEFRFLLLCPALAPSSPVPVTEQPPLGQAHFTALRIRARLLKLHNSTKLGLRACH